MPQARPNVAILLGESFDDWLDALDVTLEAFTSRMMGSWTFNYVQALQSVGVQTVIFCVSVRTRRAVRFEHIPTGATVVVLPPPRVYRLLRGCWPGRRPSGRIARAIEAGLLAYLATPVVTLFREIRHEHCRSLLVQEYESARFDMCVLYGRLRRVPVFGTFTGGRRSEWVPRSLRGVTLRCSAGVAIGAQVEAQKVRSEYKVPAEQVALIYSPVDLGVFYPADRREARAGLGIPAAASVAVFHGTIDLQYKGLDVLVEAWKQLCRDRDHADLRLLIMGTGVDAERFRTLIAQPHVRGVRWLNQWVHDRSQIRRHLSAADVYVFPSRSDACPNALIEAMACGLPVVATAVNGISDIVGSGEQAGGVLVPAGDVESLIAALGRLFDNEALRGQLGSQARARVGEHFTMRAVGMQLASLLAANPR